MEDAERDRKIGRNEEDEREEDEQMEQFFALIRSFREARNRRKRELNELEERKKKKMRKLDEEPSSWVPTFQFEDFTQEIEFQGRPIIFHGKRKEDKKVEEDEGEDDGLNLDLTL